MMIVIPLDGHDNLSLFDFGFVADLHEGTSFGPWLNPIIIVKWYDGQNVKSSTDLKCLPISFESIAFKKTTFYWRLYFPHQRSFSPVGRLTVKRYWAWSWGPSLVLTASIRDSALHLTPQSSCLVAMRRRNWPLQRFQMAIAHLGCSRRSTRTRTRSWHPRSLEQLVPWFQVVRQHRCNQVASVPTTYSKNHSISLNRLHPTTSWVLRVPTWCEFWASTDAYGHPSDHSSGMATQTSTWCDRHEYASRFDHHHQPPGYPSTSDSWPYWSGTWVERDHFTVLFV